MAAVMCVHAVTVITFADDDWGEGVLMLCFVDITGLSSHTSLLCITSSCLT